MASKTPKTIFASRGENDPLKSLNSVGTFFNGADPTAFDGIELDPFVTGYCMIYWKSLPSWFADDDDLKNFQVLTQKFPVSFNGISDVELQESSQQYGFAGNEVSFITGIQKNNTDFTIGFKEFSGTPITKSIDKWINLIRDKNTGIALYPKLYNCEYSARNHSGQLFVMFLRPDVTNTGHDNLEKAFFWSNVVPTNVPWSSLYSYELGSQDSPTSVDINFKGVMLEGPAIDAAAKKILDEKLLNVGDENNNNAHLFITSLTQAGDAGTELFKSGVLKEIYNPDK